MERFFPVYTTPGNNPCGWYIKDRKGGIVLPRWLRMDTYDEACSVAEKYNSTYDESK